jgi:hypothetical protein
MRTYQQRVLIVGIFEGSRILAINEQHRFIRQSVSCSKLSVIPLKGLGGVLKSVTVPEVFSDTVQGESRGIGGEGGEDSVERRPGLWS